MTSSIGAEIAVSSIIEDLCDRQGLGGAWDEIDPDIKDEIRSEWVKIITNHVYDMEFPVDLF